MLPMASCTLSSSLTSVTFLVLSHLFLISLTPELVDSFNVDTSKPLVKRGTSGSYFGFSVVSHSIRSNRTPNESHFVILVGAPKDNITDPSASEVVRNIERPGAVYSCPLTYDINDCKQLSIAVEDPPENEDRSDQWMGGTVVSQGTDTGVAVVCAHRFKKIGPSFSWGLGWCISLTNSLEEDRFWEPCAGRPNSHGGYGFCQAGTSAAIDQEGEIVLGAPGPVNWRGAIFSNSLHDVFQTWHQSPVEDESSPGENNRGGGGGRQQRKPATAYYSYLGMSVQIGKIISGHRTFVAGAPRSNYSGQVLLFEMTGDELTVDQTHYLTGEQFGSGFGYSISVADFNSDGLDDLVVGAPFFHHSSAAVVGGLAYVYINSEQGIHSQSRPIRLYGRKVKEAECHEWRCHDAWFGMAVAAIGDTDQDGYQDLAIGAPYERNGAVYIFRGSSSGINSDSSQRISASDLPVSVHPLHSFGHSISGGNDLDHNGYPDVLVGAYSSDSVVGLWSRPVVDIDPMIDHYPSLIDPRLTECSQDHLPFNCFQLIVCFKFSRRSQKRFAADHPVSVDFNLQAERTNDIYSRIFFTSSSSSFPSSSPSLSSSSSVDNYIYNGTIHLNAQNRSACSNVSVYLAQSNKDFLNPVKLTMTYRLSDQQKHLQKNPFNVLSATTSTASSETKEFPPVLDVVLSDEDFAAHVGVENSVDFIKNCGDDSKCEANLKVTGILQLDKNEVGQYILRTGQEQVLQLFVRITNRLEDAHETLLTVLLPKYLKYRGTNTEGRQYSCLLTEGAVHCAIGNPLPGDQEVSFAMRLDASNVDYSVSAFEIKLLVNTTSIEVDDEDNEDTLKVKVVLETDIFVIGSSDPSEVFYGGEVIGESAMRFLDDIGPLVTHSFEIKNLGKSKSPVVGVKIRWPYEVESGYPSGKHLLYLTEAPQVDDNKTECLLDERFINPLRLKTRIVQDSRLKNETESNGRVQNGRVPRSVDRKTSKKTEAIVTKEVDSSGKVINAAKLDCDSGTAKCHVIHCKAERIDPGNSVVVTITSRLWKSTFIEDYRKVDQVHVSSKAELEIELNENIRQLYPLNVTYKATTIALPDIGIQEVRGVPLWIIIASVTAGFLFLCLMTWILWKCGFFRRKRGVNMQHKAVIEKPDYHYDLLQHSTVTLTPRPLL